MHNFSILSVVISVAELPALLLADLLTETAQLLQEVDYLAILIFCYFII